MASSPKLHSSLQKTLWFNLLSCNVAIPLFYGWEKYLLREPLFISNICILSAKSVIYHSLLCSKSVSRIGTQYF